MWVAEGGIEEQGLDGAWEWEIEGLGGVVAEEATIGGGRQPIIMGSQWFIELGAQALHHRPPAGRLTPQRHQWDREDLQATGWGDTGAQPTPPEYVQLGPTARS